MRVLLCCWVRNCRRGFAATLLALLVGLGACGQRSHDGSGSSTASTQTTQRTTVHIANDVFGWADAYMTLSNESILVNGTAPPATLIQALNRAADRFMHVDETGVEHGPEVEESPPGDSNGDVLYTPNYVSTPTETSSGIRMYVDCKGVIDPRMRARFLEILTEELGIVGGDVTVSVAQ